MKDFLIQLGIIIIIGGCFFALASFTKWTIDIDNQEKQVEIDKIMNGEYNFVDLKRDITGKYHNTEKFQVTYYVEGKGYKQMEITMEQFYDFEEKFWDILEKKVDY